MTIPSADYFSMVAHCTQHHRHTRVKHVMDIRAGPIDVILIAARDHALGKSVQFKRILSKRISATFPLNPPAGLLFARGDGTEEPEQGSLDEVLEHLIVRADKQDPILVSLDVGIRPGNLRSPILGVDIGQFFHVSRQPILTHHYLVDHLTQRCWFDGRFVALLQLPAAPRFVFVVHRLNHQSESQRDFDEQTGLHLPPDRSRD